MNLKYVILISLLIFLSLSASGHQGEKDTTHMEQDHKHQIEQAGNHHHDSSLHPKDVIASFHDFPNLHPLIVHFPIVLILLASIFQIAGFFVFKREISWIVLIIVTIGFIGALIAGILAHPHTHDLSDFTAQVLAKHDFYAYLTMWASGIGVLLKVGSHFFLEGKLWPELVVALALLISAYAVSKTGHYGAQLVHIEGVGPQGKFLETDSHSH